MFERDILEIVQQFLTLGEIACPLITCAKGERVGVVRRIHAAARISIDVPRAAEFVVFLDDGVGNAKPAERNAQGNGADARANNQDMLLQGVTRWRPGPACFARNKAHLLAHQRRILRRNVFTEARAHHFEDQFIARIGDRRFWFAFREQFEHSGADFVLNVLRHSRFRIRNETDIAPGCVGRLQPAGVAGHVNQNHQQDTDIAFGDGRCQIKLLAWGLDVHGLVSCAPGNPP